MSFMKAAASWGGVLALIALLIALVKQLIAFIGLITFAVKAFIVLAFVIVFLGVAVVALRALKDKQKRKESN